MSNKKTKKQVKILFEDPEQGARGAHGGFRDPDDADQGPETVDDEVGNNLGTGGAGGGGALDPLDGAEGHSGASPSLPGAQRSGTHDLKFKPEHFYETKDFKPPTRCCPPTMPGFKGNVPGTTIPRPLDPYATSLRQDHGRVGALYPDKNGKLVRSFWEQDDMREAAMKTELIGLVHKIFLDTRNKEGKGI